MINDNQIRKNNTAKTTLNLNQKLLIMIFAFVLVPSVLFVLHILIVLLSDSNIFREVFNIENSGSLMIVLSVVVLLACSWRKTLAEIKKIFVRKSDNKDVNDQVLVDKQESEYTRVFRKSAGLALVIILIYAVWAFYDGLSSLTW